MKKLVLLAAILFGVFAFKNADAQLSISLNLNIGTQPAWGPTGYDHVDYYYLPDIDCYYYVPQQQFIYSSGGRWITSSSLPPQYGNYDLYSGYKVVVNQPKPYLQDNVYRTKYSGYKGRRGQAVIRDSHDTRYTKDNSHRPGNNYRPGNNNRPPAKPQPNRPGNNNRPPAKPQPKPQPNRPGNGGHAPAKPQPGRPANSGHAPAKPQPKPGEHGDDHNNDHH